MDILGDSMPLYVILSGFMILLYIAVNRMLTIGLVVGVMLGALSAHSEPVAEITSTITAQVTKDVSGMTSEWTLFE